MAVAFQQTLNFFYNHTFIPLSHQSHAIFLAGSFVLVVGTELVVGFLLARFCRDAAGSGIPQLKLAFWKDFGAVPARVIWVKFLAGVLSIGGGASLGREGPSVQLGGAVASNLGGALGEPKQKRRRAAAAGAAAGLAAAFNTPLASITFVLEEIIADLNSRLLGSVLLAAVIGAFVVHGLVGQQPAFTLHRVESNTWRVYLLIPFVAAIAALSGLSFQKLTLKLRAGCKKQRRISPWLQPALGGAITWLTGATVFIATGHLGVFGLGYQDLSAGLNLALTWKLAGILWITKLIATFISYGFGGCGGIFSPLLVIGGMCGLMLAGIFNFAIHLVPADQIVLAVVGMSACLGAVVGAPVTGILIVFEMTHQFSLVPALMLGALVSEALRRRLTKHNFYEGILAQDGHHLENVIPPRDLQSWQQLPVSTFANFQPVAIQDLSPAAIQEMLHSHPYQRFPVAQNGSVTGVLTRKEAESSLAEKRAPKLDTPVTCYANQTIRDLQHLLIESTSLMVVVINRPSGTILGLMTLHDLLRAEVAMSNKSD
jgi:CIC family chloride channel protein